MSKIIFENRVGLYRFKHDGSPIKEFETGDEEEYDFNEIVEIAWDSDTAPGQGVKCKKFEVREICVPPCYSVDFFIRNYIGLKYFERILRMSKVEITILSKRDFESFWKIYKKDGLLLFAILKLWKSKPRSEFRQSLKSQFENWLVEENRKYETPFSFKQQSCLKNRYIQHNYECLMSHF